MGILERGRCNNLSVIEKMQKVLIHRGPDDKGTAQIEIQDESKLLSCSLGFVRLSIRDLSYSGHQPMYSDSKNVCLIFNGEIYNSEELRPKLLEKGVTFKGTSDTEVLLHLYMHYGIDQTLQMLDGMFAICLVDSRINKVYLIRDRIGEKPLYFYKDGEQLMFASEYKAFYCNPNFNAILDNNALSEYFLFRYVSGNETFLKGVMNVSPGTYLEISPSKIVHKTYWSLPIAKPNCLSYEENKTTLKQLLIKSVRRRLISDRPVGIQLSGGVDSSFLCSLVKRECNKSLSTYSIIFNNPHFSEEKHIDYVNELLNLKNRKFEFNPEKLIEYWQKGTYHFEAPMNFAGSLGLFMINKEASKAVTVMLCGDGPDECMGGYFRHHLFSKIVSNNSFLNFYNWKVQQLKCLKNHKSHFSDKDDFFISLSQWIRDDVIKQLRPNDYKKDIKKAYLKRRKELGDGSGQRVPLVAHE